jgi:hypothetical protein
VWTPTANTVYSGNVSFTYTATDRAGATVDGTATVRVSAPDMSPISIKFFPSNGLVPPTGMNNRTYTGTTVAGVIRIAGVPGVGGLTVTISKNGGPGVRTVSRFTSFAAAAVTTDAVMGTPQTFHVEAFQSALPGQVDSKLLMLKNSFTFGLQITQNCFKLFFILNKHRTSFASIIWTNNTSLFKLINNSCGT